MSMTVPVARMRIARDISAAEKALDEALIRHSSLFTTMVSARLETGSAELSGDIFGRDVKPTRGGISPFQKVGG